ncbi:hypothetical protein D3C75_1132970 [compost metagenome]
MGADRIAQVHIRLAEGDGPDSRQCRGEQLNLGLGIEPLDVLFRQVVVEHRQALAGQCRVQHLECINAGHQYRLIHRIGAGHF